ncbi:MAG: AAA family ATPase, partial [Roseibium sp.]|uniref:AAA family ATPase n=1 Tax=Roseibium sp. TaxID=1936156 RepID=UPI003298B8D1
ENDQPEAANLVFNRYFDKLPVDARESANELQGLAALPFYLMMRAAIRAKIAASAAKAQHTETDRRAQEEEAVSYFNQAIAFLDPGEPDLVAIGGFSGTGKTTLAYALAPEIGRAPGARVLRTDIERKKRLGLPETQKAPGEAYTRAATEAVYNALETALQTTLASGHSALFDAVFADEKERARIEQLAKAVEASFCGLWLDAPAETLMERVSTRQGDASDATTEVVDLQLSYELGDMNWSVIDAGGEPPVTLQNAKQVIGKILPQKP